MLPFCGIVSFDRVTFNCEMTIEAKMDVLKKQARFIPDTSLITPNDKPSAKPLLLLLLAGDSALISLYFLALWMDHF